MSVSQNLGALEITAWWTAAARARETRQANRLFDDPWAGLLVGPAAEQEYEGADGRDAADDVHSVTTRFFDDFAMRSTELGGIRQVVVVACGLDTRAFRLAWPHDTRLFEIDQHRVLAFKDCLLTYHGATPSCDRRAVAANLREPWGERIVEAGFDRSEPSLWLLEQCLYFFEPTAAHLLLATISELSTTGSRLGFDIVNGEMLTSPVTRQWAQRTATIGAPWLFTSDEPEALLADYGWSTTVTEPGNEGADYGRYPYRVVPRSSAGVPRSFLVTATRESV